jgi:hypothetical protein
MKLGIVIIQDVHYEERGQGVEKTHGFNRGMNRTPCITTENYKSNKGINYLLTCTAPLR